MPALTFADVKADIGTVVAGGVSGADPRVLTRTNAAMRALMEDVPQGIFVGGVMAAVVQVNTTGGVNQITLPPGMDVAFVVELEQPSIALNGWFNIVNPATFIDPDDILDTVLVDLGFTGQGGARMYGIPELPANTTAVKIYGLRAFTPVALDTDVLIIQNPRAIKRMVLALDKSERYNDPATGEVYRKEAVMFLVSELDRALTDPLRFGIRMAQWRLDLQAFPPGTLGNTMAKIALDMRTGQRIGRMKINRLVTRALSWIYQRIFEYELIERNRIRDAVPTLGIVPTDPAAVLNPTVQHEIIRATVQAVMAEDNQGLDEDRGSGRLAPGAELGIAKTLFTEAATTLTRFLDAQLEQLRHATYAPALAAIIAADGTSSRGFVAYTWALKTEGGLKFSTVEINRFVIEAVRQAVLIYNAFGKTERYSNSTGPTVLTFTPPTSDAAVLVYADYEVLDLLMQAQVPGLPNEQSVKLKAEAATLIERNLATLIDQARNTQRYARLGMDPGSLGYLTARLGLEVPSPDSALTYSDNQFRRWTNEAAREAIQQRNALARTERYSNLAGPDAMPFVYAATDDAAVSYPDLEILRRLVAAQITDNPENARGLRTETAALVERNLQKQIEATRNQKWQCLLGSNPFPQFGGFRAQMALEYGGDGGADGYRLSDEFASRIAQQAWSMAADQVNFFSRAEDYQEAVVPLPAPTPLDTDIVPFSLEILKLYAEAQLCQDRNEEERATSYKNQATQTIQRNLIGVIERGRREVCQQQLTLGEYTFGRAVGRLGLELPGGLSMSDAMRKRLVNEAEELLADSGRWKFFEAEYFLSVGLDGIVSLPADVENIIYAERCGHSIDLKDRRWQYAGWVARIGENLWDGWHFHSGQALDYIGPDATGSATYKLTGWCPALAAWFSNSGYPRPPLRALCRRKWLMKVNDTDPLLIQCYPALKSGVQSLLNKSGAQPDYQGASIKWNIALKALDNQLGVETEGQTPMVKVEFPGLPRGGTTRRGCHHNTRY